MITTLEYSLIFRPRAIGSKVLIKVFQEIECENLCQQKYEERLKDEDFGDTKYGRVRKYLWNLTEYPETSKAALILGYCSLSLVIVSTITFVLSTFPGEDIYCIKFTEKLITREGNTTGYNILRSCSKTCVRCSLLLGTMQIDNEGKGLK